MVPANRLLATITILIGLLLPVLVLEIALQIIGVYGGLEREPVTRDQMVRRYVANQHFSYTQGPYFQLSNSGRINNYGFVNDQDYDPDAPLPLVGVIGDSYIEAIMVPYADTLHARLAERLAGSARVYSFGLYGSALSDYLIYADYVNETFGADMLVVTVVGNDFDQSLMRYRQLPGFHGYEELANGEFRSVLTEYDPSQDFARRWAEKSALIRYLFYNSGIIRRLYWSMMSRTFDHVGNTRADYDPTRLDLSMRVVDLFLQELARRASLEPEDIVLVVDGVRPALYCEGCLEEVEDKFFPIMRAYFIVEATSRGYEVVDMQPRFIERYRQTGKRFEPESDGHWNSRGHEEVAAAVLATRAIARHWPVASRAGSE